MVILLMLFWYFDIFIYTQKIQNWAYLRNLSKWEFKSHIFRSMHAEKMFFVFF